jgi:hypothetical protein
MAAALVVGTSNRALSLAVVGALITVGVHGCGGSPVSVASKVAPPPPLVFSEVGTPVLVSALFYFTEGPVWDPTQGVLYFTDINATDGTTVGGAVYRLTPPDTIDLVVQPTGNADGLALDPNGGLAAAGFVSRDVWRLSSSNPMAPTALAPTALIAPCTPGPGTCCSRPVLARVLQMHHGPPRRPENLFNPGAVALLE